MKIYLTDPDGKIYWLAGHDCAPECERGSVSGYSHQGAALAPAVEYVRGLAGEFWDRGNFTTQILFSARRTFETTGEALLFIADYDRTTPREGVLTLLIENPAENGGFEKRYLLGALVSPPAMTPLGCTVDMAFNVSGSGAVTDTLPE